MSSVQVLPLGNYSGSHSAGPIDVADDVTSVDFSVARCTTATPTIWPNTATTLRVVPQMSIDGGLTWIECGAFTAQGGIGLGKGGVESPFSIGGGSLPAPVNGITRRYQVTATITNGPLRSSMTIEVN